MGEYKNMRVDRRRALALFGAGTAGVAGPSAAHDPTVPGSYTHLTLSGKWNV